MAKRPISCAASQARAWLRLLWCLGIALLVLLPESFAAIRAEIEASFDRPLEALFTSVDPEPVGAASIAQVHAARLDGGREVVVKVLRPRIEKQIAADIGLLRSLAALVDRIRRYGQPALKMEDLPESARLLMAG